MKDCPNKKFNKLIIGYSLDNEADVIDTIAAIEATKDAAIIKLHSVYFR